MCASLRLCRQTHRNGTSLEEWGHCESAGREILHWASSWILIEWLKLSSTFFVELKGNLMIVNLPMERFKGPSSIPSPHHKRQWRPGALMLSLSLEAASMNMHPCSVVEVSAECMLGNKCDAMLQCICTLLWCHFCCWIYAQNRGASLIGQLNHGPLLFLRGDSVFFWKKTSVEVIEMG